MTTAGEAAFAAMQAGAVQKRAELARLLEIADARFEGLGRPPRILEVGSYMGGTLCAWRRMWPDAFVVAVDLPDPPDRPIVAHGAHLIVGDSHDVATARLVVDRLMTDVRGRGLATEEEWGVDMLFLDGDHSLPSVWRDLELYGPMISPGGLLAMHDVTPYDEGKSPALGAELAWDGLDRWTRGVEWEGRHQVIAPVWRRLGAIIDRMPQPDGRAAWWGGIGMAERVPAVFDR